jgi:hypothetical protein
MGNGIGKSKSKFKKPNKIGHFRAKVGITPESEHVRDLDELTSFHCPPSRFSDGATLAK